MLKLVENKHTWLKQHGTSLTDVLAFSVMTITFSTVKVNYTLLSALSTVHKKDACALNVMN